ncbi:MAG TPA: hypothetical protein PLZ93_11655, partial [Nocardioides sp.]|nr:hypothetical protein [Nocardioides sp.]
PGQGGPGGDPSQFAAIQQCLEAAGLGDEFPTDMPTDRPSDFPTDGTPPSGFPSDGPGGGGPGGAGGLLQDPDVQAALKACGIEVPTGRPSGAPSQPAS